MILKLFHSIEKSLLVGILLIWSLNAVYGQNSETSISGKIKDPNKDLVQGAEVFLESAGNTSLKTVSDAGGTFIFKNLTAGFYTIIVKANGFVEYRQENVEVKNNQNQAVEINLGIEVSETVKVGENNLSTDPYNSSVLVLRGRDLDFLPNNPDDLASVLSVLSGAVGPNGAEFLVDGFSGVGGRLPNRKQISEITVNQNPFTAEYERIGFGRVSLNLSPTTEEFHGETEFYFSDETLNSRNPFSSNKPPFQVRNFFGALSGPLIKKKASFYIGLAREAFDSNAVINAVVLNNLNQPSSISRGVLTPSREIYSLFRVDYKLSKNTDLVLNYQYLPSESKGVGIGRQTLESRGYTSEDKTSIYRILGTSVISPQTVYQIRFQFIDNKNQTSDVVTTPTINVLDSFVSGGASVGNSVTNTKRLELQNHVTTTFGRNTLRFGGSFRFSNIRDNTPQNFNGSYVFEGGDAPQLDAGGNIILTGGQPTTIDINSLERYRRTIVFLQQGLSPAEVRRRGGGATQFSIAAGNPITQLDQKDVGVYAQYDWRVSPTLNFGLGLRYESQTNISNNLNFAPRISFAWAPGATENESPKTIVRGGFGVFYGRVPDIISLQARQLDGIRQQNYISELPSVLDSFPNLPSLSLLETSPQNETIRRVASDLRSTHSYQTALSVERELLKGTTFSATFIAARYLHLLRSRNINAPLPGTFNQNIPNSGIRPFPGLGNIYQFESSGVLNQTQMVFNLTSRLTPKIFVFSSYTLNKSKSNTNGATSFPLNSYDLTYEYGRANNDIRHRFNLGATISAPYGIRLSPFVTARSGIPFNITTGDDFNGDTLFLERPAFAVNTNKPGLINTRFGLFDPNPDAGQQLIPLNYGQGPNFFVFNLRAAKEIPFGPGKPSPNDKNKTERPYSLTLSVEAQNIFNRNNAASPIGNLSSPLFGFSTSSSTEAGSSNSDSNRRINFSINISF